MVPVICGNVNISPRFDGTIKLDISTSLKIKVAVTHKITRKVDNNLEQNLIMITNRGQ